MYDAVYALGQLVDAINAGFDAFRILLRENFIDPYDALPTWIHLSVWMALISWFLGAIGFDSLVPAFKNENLEDGNFIKNLAEFVGQELRIEINPELALPSVYVVEDETQFLEHPDYSYAPEDMRGKYTPCWQRIHLRTKRIDILVHELVHYFQHIYRGKTRFEDKDHAEAWIVAAKFMRRRYPLHYWSYMFLYGHLGLWDSKFAIL